MCIYVGGGFSVDFFATLEFHYRCWCGLALHLKYCQELYPLTSWEIVELMRVAFLTGAAALCSFGFYSEL